MTRCSVCRSEILPPGLPGAVAIVSTTPKHPTPVTECARCWRVSAQLDKSTLPPARSTTDPMPGGTASSPARVPATPARHVGREQGSSYALPFELQLQERGR